MSRRPNETTGGVFIYHNLKGGVPYLLPAIGLAFFISRKRRFDNQLQDLFQVLQDETPH